MARNWRDIRADAVAQGRVDLQRAAVAREEMRDAVLAHRLAEIRKALGQRTSGRRRGADGGLSGPCLQAGERRPVPHRTRHPAGLRCRPGRAPAHRR